MWALFVIASIAVVAGAWWIMWWITKPTMLLRSIENPNISIWGEWRFSKVPEVVRHPTDGNICKYTIKCSYCGWSKRNLWDWDIEAHVIHTCPTVDEAAEPPKWEAFK